MFSHIGKRTPVAVRFSTVSPPLGIARIGLENKTWSFPRRTEFHIATNRIRSRTQILTWNEPDSQFQQLFAWNPLFEFVINWNWIHGVCIIKQTNPDPPGQWPEGELKNRITKRRHPEFLPYPCRFERVSPRVLAVSRSAVAVTLN